MAHDFAVGLAHSHGVPNHAHPVSPWQPLHAQPGARLEARRTIGPALGLYRRIPPCDWLDVRLDGAAREVKIMVTESATTTLERMKEVGERMDQAWQAHDVEGLIACLTDDVVWTDPSLGRLTGKTAVAAGLRELFAAFPNMAWDQEKSVALFDPEAGIAAVEWFAAADMTGPFQGAPATGRHETTAGMNVMRWRGDLICDYRFYYDRVPSLEQLGILPRLDGVVMKGVALATVSSGKAKRAVLHR